MAALIDTGVTYKRTSRSQKVINKVLPDAWGIDGVRHYGKSLSETLPEIVVTCWFHGHIECLYRNGNIA